MEDTNFEEEEEDMKNQKLLVNLDNTSRIWRPSRFPLLFKNLRLHFPELSMEFFHLESLPKTVYGNPKHVQSRWPSSSWISDINGFRVWLTPEWVLEAWGTPRREKMRIRSLSPRTIIFGPKGVWNAHLPLYDTLREWMHREQIGFTSDARKRMINRKWILSIILPIILLQVVRFITIELLDLPNLFLGIGIFGIGLAIGYLIHVLQNNSERTARLYHEHPDSKSVEDVFQSLPQYHGPLVSF